MKIAEVVCSFPPYQGGIGNVCYNNSLGLKKLGNKVSVFTVNYSKLNYNDPKGLNINRLKPLFSYGNSSFLLGLLKIKDFDVIHLHYPFYISNGLIYLVSKIRKIPYVVTYHMDVVGKGWLKYFFKIHNKFIMRGIIKGADKVFVTSLDYAENSQLKQIFDRIKDKIIEIPNGVDIKKFNQNIDSSKLRKRLGISNKEKVILFVGALDKPHYFKGVDILLNAFSKINIGGVKIIIVGDGDLKKNYVQLSKDLDIQSRVIFAGRVSDKELPEYYSLCDFSVLPSTDKGEAFGMVLVEAMACAKPVIASNLAGVRSVVDVNKNGLLVKPGDENDLKEKIKQMLKSKNLVQMGKNGRIKAEKLYSWDNINKKLNKELSNLN
jgi:glycosyltransferase involved in cell wall biosynthesis